MGRRSLERWNGMLLTAPNTALPTRASHLAVYSTDRRLFNRQEAIQQTGGISICMILECKNLEFSMTWCVVKFPYGYEPGDKFPSKM
jgi:hypothetical protein